jgi:hypothetical protein
MTPAPAARTEQRHPQHRVHDDRDNGVGQQDQYDKATLFGWQRFDMPSHPHDPFTTQPAAHAIEYRSIPGTHILAS